MKNILIVTGHPYADSSVGNKEIVRHLLERYPSAQHSDLASLYPDYQVDIEAEREKLLWADVIIIQSPLFWYSMTSLIMRWFEEVFTHGWAYGSKGHALDGKQVLIGLTAGGTGYEAGGEMGITVDDLLKPIQLIFDYCRMDYLGAIFTEGMFNTGNATAEQVVAMKTLAKQHSQDMIDLLDKAYL